MLISADAEGVTGVTNTNELMFGRPYYEFMRTMMTDGGVDVVDGAYAGGATSVVGNDGHWTMTNVQIERLDPRAEPIKGFHKHLAMVEGVQEADAVLFLGYHARTGDSDAVANETILGREIVEIRMNGRAVGESEINAAVCGELGVPVVFASDDDLYEKELRETFPDVEFGLTKYALDRWTAPPPARAQPRQHPRRGATRGGLRPRRGVRALPSGRPDDAFRHVLLDRRGPDGLARARQRPRHPAHRRLQRAERRRRLEGVLRRPPPRLERDG